MEQTKAKIEFIKTLFLVFVATLFSMVGYLFVNFYKLSEIKIFFLIYGIFIFIVINILIIMFWLRSIKKLKD